MKKSDYKFTQPYIKESVFVINDGFVRESSENININTTANSYTNYKDGQEENFAICGLTIQIGNRTDSVPFFVRVTMEAKFSWESKSEDDIKVFLKVNAPSLLTGYIRPIITFLTANSPYPPFNLEFINFVE